MEIKKYIKKLEIKNHIIRLLKILGISYLNIMGFSIIIVGAIDGLIWVMFIGWIILDLSPSLIKTIIEDTRRLD